MSNPNLIILARQVNESMEQLRGLLPGVPDDQILVIAKFISGGQDTQIQKLEPSPDTPVTLAVALEGILKESKQATRGELYRALQLKGWTQTLANGREIYGVMGRVLAGPQFERVHWGMYRLRLEKSLPKSEKSLLDLPSEIVPVYEMAKTLGQPFLAKSLAVAMGTTVAWLVPRLKVLREKGYAKHAGHHANGTAEWAVV
jgi:hypothetical protein